MATEPASIGLGSRERADDLAQQWRRLARVATVVAVMTAPAIFAWFSYKADWSLGWALLGTFLVVVAFRGAFDVLTRPARPRTPHRAAQRGRAASRLIL